MVRELSQEKIIHIFESSWNKLIETYSEKRLLPSWCSEGDIQLNLAHNLLTTLSPSQVHIEFPIPLDVTTFADQLYYNGRVKRTPGKCIVADICLLDDDNLYPYLIAEIKFQPVYIGYYDLFHALRLKEQGNDYSPVVDRLRNLIPKLESWAVKGPSKREISTIYLKNIQKMINILKDFKNIEKRDVIGYVCIIDEIYSDLKDRLSAEIKKINPPDNFRLIINYINMKESLNKILARLLE